jgi:predicted dienelactone hydrolase
MIRFPTRTQILILVLSFISLAETADKADGVAAATPSAYKPAAGPHAVKEVKELVVHDAKRKKDLKVKVYYPDGKGPFPVLVFSHGFGGNKDAFAYLSRFLAGYGYVSIHPDHADAGALRRLKGGLAELRQRVSDSRAWGERVRDVSCLLDAFPEIEKKVPALKGRLDGRRVGVAGHSFGAYTAMLLAGATVDLPRGPKAHSFADARVRAILPVSAQGTSHVGLTKESWKRMKLPMLTVTGTRDRGLGGHDPAWRQEPFKYSPPGDKYLLVIEGANHSSYGGARFGGGPARVTDYVKVAAIAFWDAYLKGDRTARAYLQSDRLQTYGQGAVKFSKK